MSGFDLILTCLALNVYHEARGEGIPGQLAVAHVTLNRARDTGQHVCDVVFEPKQFSWTCRLSKNGVLKKEGLPKDKWAWEIAKGVALASLYQEKDPSKGARYYHATSVTPDWSFEKVKVATIGDHIFYR